MRGSDIATARVTFDDDRADSRIRIHVHHPQHDRGVRAFSRTSPETAIAAVRRHLARELEADITAVDVEDRAGIGVTETDLLGETDDAVPSQTGQAES